jgi:hypothetical protein
MIFFISTHTRCSVERGFLTLYLVVLISFYKNWSKISQLVPDHLKNTRKTIFDVFSKLKLLEVIRLFRVTYSRRPKSRKSTSNTRRRFAHFSFIYTLFPATMQCGKSGEYHDVQALRKVKRGQSS